MFLLSCIFMTALDVIHKILKICISDWNLTEHIGLSRRRGQQLVPVRDIHLAQTQGKIRLGFNGVAFSEKYYFEKY